MAAVSLEACCVSRFEPSVVSLLDNVGDVVGQSPLRPEKKSSRPTKRIAAAYLHRSSSTFSAGGRDPWAPWRYQQSATTPCVSIGSAGIAGMAVKTMSRRQVVIDCVRASPLEPGERDVSVIPALGRLIDPVIELCVSVMRPAIH